MLKYVGIIIVSGAVSLYGAYLSSGIIQRKKTRAALLELLIYIKSNIENAALPLETIYKNFSDKYLEKSGFIEKLRSGRPDALYYALENTDIVFDEGIMELYMGVAKNIGTSAFKDVEAEKLKSTIPLIKAQTEKLDKYDDSKSELYKKLGILAGLFLAILLL